jgi:hypothetical protein
MYKYCVCALSSKSDPKIRIEVVGGSGKCVVDSNIRKCNCFTTWRVKCLKNTPARTVIVIASVHGYIALTRQLPAAKIPCGEFGLGRREQSERNGAVLGQAKTVDGHCREYVVQ